jgi:hypothetical protein
MKINKEHLGDKFGYIDFLVLKLMMLLASYNILDLSLILLIGSLKNFGNLEKI